MRPFFYVIKHKNTGKLYAGYCSSKKHCNSQTFMTEHGYQTSSKVVAEIISNEGVSSFEVNRVRHFNDKLEALSYEARFLQKVDAMKNNRFLNRANGNKKFHASINGTLSDQHKESLKRAWKTRAPITVSDRANRSERAVGRTWWNDGIVNKFSHTRPDGNWIPGMVFKRRKRRS